MKDFKKILKYASPYKRGIFFAFLCLAVTSIITLVLPLLVRNMVNAVMVKKNAELLNGLAIDVLIVILFQAVFGVTHSYILGWIGQRVTTDFRVELFSHIQSLSMRFFNNRRVGEIVSRMSNDISVIQNALVSIPVALFRQTIILVGGLGIICYLNWRLTGLILLVLPPLMIFARIFGRKLRKSSEQVQDRLAKAVVVLEETVSSIKIVKSYNREKHERSRFVKEMETAFESSVDKVRIGSFFGPFILALTFLVSGTLIWYGGQQVLAGTTTPGELAAFFLYAVVIAGPIGTFVRLYTQIQECLGSVKRVYEILDTEPEITNSDNPVVPTKVEGKIAFAGVDFGYSEDAPVLKDVSFEIPAGQMAAIVGPSGAGKSTIVQLLHRFYDPDRGSIQVDGQDIRQWDIENYRDQIAYVPQETHLFGGSIRENILYGKLDATEDELIEAAKSANAHDFIVEMEKGYDTEVGEKGVKLSGGQRQRIAIARALLKKPKILILDEATSSLDSQSESLVQEALELLMSRCTTLTIAHRLSTVHNADRIIVLDKGSVVETGDHQELMAQKKLYYHLYTLNLLEGDPPPQEELHDDSGLATTHLQ